MRTQDWEHRLHVLQAWQTWVVKDVPKLDDGATYRAVLDGCSINVRALLTDTLKISCDFRGQAISPTDPNRFNKLRKCLNNGTPTKLFDALAFIDQSNLLEVLYHANRTVAHPGSGTLDHKVGQPEMKSAINTVLGWLDTPDSKHQWPALAAVRADFFRRIP